MIPIVPDEVSIPRSPAGRRCQPQDIAKETRQDGFCFIKRARQWSKKLCRRNDCTFWSIMIMKSRRCISLTKLGRCGRSCHDHAHIAHSAVAQLAGTPFGHRPSTPAKVPTFTVCAYYAHPLQVCLAKPSSLQMPMQLQF